MTTSKNQKPAADGNRHADHDGVLRDRLLTEKEVATRQGRSVRTLQNQRVNGDGIPLLKFGRSVRYRITDVLAWEEGGRCLSTSSEDRRHGW